MLLSFFVVAGLYSTVCQAEPRIAAHTVNGTFVGKHNSYYDQDEFLGMPYAQPPLGDLRFRSPVSLNKTWSGAKKAVEYSPICVGYGGDSNGFHSDEDCLTLNLVRPSSTEKDAELPVMVWFYGGGFYEGGTQDLRYNMSRLVMQATKSGNPIIAVSFNYRLSAWGFLWSDEVSRLGGHSNVGLHDQRMALRWVQENIAAFGGSPDKVTVFGESAGAIAIGRHLTAYGGRDDGLFRAAIMESGGALERWPYDVYDPSSYQNELYANLTSSTGCNASVNSLECLRALPFTKLNAALNITDTWIAGTGLGPWVTVMDGDILREYQSEAMKAGRFVKVPILYGTNSDEGTGIAPNPLKTDAELAAAIANGGPDAATVSEVMRLYPNTPDFGDPAGYVLSNSELETYGSNYKRAAAFWGDIVEHMPRRACVTEYARRNVTAFSYRFNVVPAGIPAIIGSTHYQEVAFVFNNIEGAGYGINPFNGSLIDRPAYLRISTLMSRMWASFATHIDPNFHGEPGYPTWPSYKLDGPVGDNFVFDANASYIEKDVWRLEQMQYLYDKAGEQWKF